MYGIYVFTASNNTFFGREYLLNIHISYFEEWKDDKLFGIFLFKVFTFLLLFRNNFKLFYI